MKRFAVRFAVFLLPLWMVLAVYLRYDPFEVVYPRDRYYSDPRIAYNRESQSTNIFLANHGKVGYDSFIFGSSRSLAFLCRDWEQYLDSRGTYHFDASGETLLGIYRKVRFLENRGVVFRNGLLVLDAETLEKTNAGKGIVFIPHPKVSGGSYLDYHLTFLRVFVVPKFFIGYLDYKANGHVRPRFRDTFDMRDFQHDPITNDLFFISDEKEIREGPERYYTRRKGTFYKREGGKTAPSPPVIGETQRRSLQEIQKALSRSGGEGAVVISPLYDQKLLNRQDLVVLEEIFGKENVHDFSGVNRYTRDEHNYYEASHYRHAVARRIMREIYMPVR